MILPASNWKPRDYQIPIWQYLEHGGKHAEWIVHRRAGKDEVALHHAACKAHERVGNYWHMLPEASQARKAIWGAVDAHTGQRRIDKAFPVELRATTREQEMQIVFKNGSTWQVVGSDNYNSLVGSNPVGIVYSEWALANPNARSYLRPILAENEGWQVFITTPRGRNHAHTTLKAAEKTKGSFAQILDATQTSVFTKEQLQIELDAYIDDFGLDYGTARFEQEYMCSFDAANLGAILASSITKIERLGRVNDNVKFDPDGGEIFISADIGRRDTATWYFWQPRIGGHSIIDYDGGWGIDADEWCDNLQVKLSQYKLSNGQPALGKIWLPHDARNKTFSAKYSAVEVFMKRFGNTKIGITPMCSKADRVNAARKIIMRCEFNETNCEQGLKGLRAWAYEYNEATKTFSSDPLHDWASHDGDGFSYGCVIINLQKPVETKIIKPIFWDSQTLAELWADTPKKDKRI